MLLGKIITKIGIKVDSESIKFIAQISFRVNKKAMQSFLGKINFLRKLIFNYAQIVKPLHGMIKKDAVYKWDKDDFSQIKQVIADAPALYSPNYEK